MSWIDQAHDAMRQLIADGEPFTADDLLARVGSPDPSHAANSRNSTIGAVFGQYSAGGQIVAVGTRQSQAPSRKGGLIRVWQRSAQAAPDTLFDLAPFGGPPRKARQRPQRPDEIRLVYPWELLAGHLGPKAHLLTPDCPPNRHSALRTRCGRYGYRITVEGQPMAKLCLVCWALRSDAVATSTPPQQKANSRTL